MRLTRNITADGRCKYALVRLDKIRLNESGEEFSTECDSEAIQDALNLLHREGLLEYGEKGSREEFFAIKLKDCNAPTALFSYAEKAALTDDELAKDVFELAIRARARTDLRKPD